MNWRRLNLYVGLITLILTVILIFEGSAEAKRYNLRKYLPLRQGITWNYLQVYSDGSKNYEFFCIGGTEEVDGIVTRKEWEFDSGELEYYDYSYDCMAWTRQGLKIYKSVCSDGSYIMRTPPAICFPPFMRLGDTFEHTSTCTEYDPDGNVMDTWPWIIQLTLEGEEDITVKAGTFLRCLKFSVREYDEGRWEEFTIWLAPGIGDIKWVRDHEDRELLTFTRGHKTYCPVD